MIQATPLPAAAFSEWLETASADGSAVDCGGFECDGGKVGWGVRNGLFWAHNLTRGKHPRSGAVLIMAAISEGRKRGFDKVYWQVVPHEHDDLLQLKRAVIDCICMHMEI